MKYVTWRNGRHGILKVLCWVVIGMFLSCEEALELEENGSSVSGVGLIIQVQQESLVKSAGNGYYPEGSQIGVFVRALDGSLYDNLAYTNICYSASGDDANQSWSVDPEHPISLSITKGSCYAYYPWQTDVASLNEIIFMNDGTDWMYTSTPATNLSIKNPVAQLEMVHAMTIIRCHLQKGNYEGSGVVHGVSVAGSGLAHGAQLDLQSGTFPKYFHVGAEIGKELSSSIGSGTVTEDLWAFPLVVECALNFKIHVDERTLVAQSEPMTLSAGLVYDFTLTVDGASIQLSEVTVSDWFESANDDLDSVFDPTDQKLDWEAAKALDGVYAITTDGRAIPAEYANGLSYAGVAFVLRGKAYEVAPTEPAGVNANQEVYWHKTDKIDIENLTNYSTVDGNFEHVYMDGISEPNISTAPDAWVFGALTDMAGAENTAAIMTALTVDGVPLENTIAEAVWSYRNAVGQDNWFVPACGQLAFMMNHYQEINAILDKVEGAQFIEQKNYWSSSERNAGSVWSFYLNIKYVAYGWKIYSQRLRLIREL